MSDAQLKKAGSVSQFLRERRIIRQIPCGRSSKQERRNEADPVRTTRGERCWQNPKSAKDKARRKSTTPDTMPRTPSQTYFSSVLEPQSQMVELCVGIVIGYAFAGWLDDYQAFHRNGSNLVSLR